MSSTGIGLESAADSGQIWSAWKEVAAVAGDSGSRQYSHEKFARRRTSRRLDPRMGGIEIG